VGIALARAGVFPVSKHLGKCGHDDDGGGRGKARRGRAHSHGCGHGGILCEGPSVAGWGRRNGRVCQMWNCPKSVQCGKGCKMGIVCAVQYRCREEAVALYCKIAMIVMLKQTFEL